jgi:protein-S-isoprenylcysteine O-methyltransferase Ste14
MSEMMNSKSESQAVQTSSTWMRLIVRFLIYAAILVGIWRLTSGTWASWQGWFYIALDVGLGLMAAVWVPLTPEMEEERTSMKEGVKSWDKYIVLPLSFWYPFGLLILAGLDWRFGWSTNFAAYVVLLAALLAVGGRVFATWAAASNPFYGRFVRIQRDRGHTVIDSGPYAIVRHPGYAGLIVFLLAAGVILCSWWTVLANGMISLVLIIRTALEDRTLQDELEGYITYAELTRYRLLPGVW